jgi:multiple sugar transport system permease protein
MTSIDDRYAATRADISPAHDGARAIDTRPASAPESAARAHERRLGWMLLSPALLLLGVMTVGPAIYLLYSSVHDVQLFGGANRFVGLRNFRQLLTDSSFGKSLLVTFAFVALAVGFEVMIGLALAMGLMRRIRSNAVAATLLLLPFAVTPVVSAMVFKQLLDPNYGWVDYYLSKIGVLPAHLDWLSEPATAWIALVVLDVWQWTPFVALIILAGLQTLPQEVLEAAAVDGAKPGQIFRHITLPMVTPFLAIAVVLRSVQAFKTFDAFQVLTGGGPGESTEIVNLGIYRTALQSFRVGAASAVGLVFLLILSLLVPALLRVVGRNAQPEEH